MDLKQALSFPFDDDDWVTKAGISVLIFLIGLIFFWLIIPYWLAIFVSYGYTFEVAKRVRDNHPEPLPGWKDYQAYLGRGFRLYVGYFITYLPSLIVMIPAYAAFFGVFLLPAFGASISEEAGLIAFVVAGIGASLAFSCLYIVFIAYLILISFNMFGAMVRFMDREEISVFLEFKQNIKLVTEDQSLMVTLILFAFVGYGITMVLSSTGIGYFAVPFFYMYFYGHLTGQFAKAVAARNSSQPAVQPGV